MTSTMTSEMYWLTLTAVLTGLLSIPYVLNIMSRQWPLSGLRLFAAPPLPGEDRFAWGWGERAYRAHMNATENLAVFAPLALAVHVTGSANGVTAFACAVYFWARLIHAPFFILNIPYVRTTAWTVGLGACFVLAYQLLV